MRRASLAGLVAAAAVLASGCANLGAAPCPTGQTPSTTVQLYFGRNIGGSLGVREADFTRFVDMEITPRFPDGLTVTSGDGQYNGKDGHLVREPSKIVTLIMPAATPEVAAKLDAIRTAYKSRFHQDSVLMVTAPSCSAF